MRHPGALTATDVSTAQYRILAPDGRSREDGRADVQAGDGSLVLAPAGQGVLRIPFGHIASVTEPEPYTVRVGLADGGAIELSRLGVMRTQLLAELRDGRADGAAAAARAVGEPEVFSGIAGGVPAELRVYEDCLLITGDAVAERISFSFAGPVQVQDYVLTLQVAGREPVMVSRLGSRTGELAGLLTERLREARGRTSAFLASLLPGLDPMAVREAAGLLRDGVAVAAADLDRIHPDLTRTLATLAALPDRQDAITALARNTQLAIGFRQLTSVRRPAVGAEPWHDHAAAPHIGQHETDGGGFQPGLAGAMAAGIIAGGAPSGYGGGFGNGAASGYGGGFGALGAYWAFRALGAGLNGPGPRPMAARPALTRGLLTPATEDAAALTVTGQDPTVLAFALGSRNRQVIYEVLNLQDPPTCVFRAADPVAFNRALDDAGFHPEAAGTMIAQVPHDHHWAERMGTLFRSDL
jgi:hypothetical protein